MHEAIKGDPSPQPSVFRVSMPAEFLFDLNKFQKIQKDILGRLGCPGCTSGFDIRWDFRRNFVVDAKGEIQDAAGFGL